MTDGRTVLLAAVYDDVSAALADLDAVAQLHEQELIGHVDAAVIDQEDGQPHIVKRLESPRTRLIPEAFGGGALPRAGLHEAAAALEGPQAALVVVGEGAVHDVVRKALTGAVRSTRRSYEAEGEKLIREIDQDVLG